jgi:hypothetical protein
MRSLGPLENRKSCLLTEMRNQRVNLLERVSERMKK